MPHHRPKRPDLGDLLLLGFAAGGYVGLVMMIGDWYPDPVPAWKFLHPNSPSVQYLEWLILHAACLLMPLSWAMLAMQLRPSRSLARRARLKPGVVATILGTSGSVFLSLAMAAMEVAREFFGTPFSFGFSVCFRKTIDCGLLIAGAWVALAIGGRFRFPRGDWLDALSATVGGGWIVIWLVAFCELAWLV